MKINLLLKSLPLALVVAGGATLSYAAVQNQRLATAETIARIPGVPQQAFTRQENPEAFAAARQAAAPAKIHRVSAADLEGKNLQTIISEDFSGFTEGTEDAPIVPENTAYQFDIEGTHTPGWSGQLFSQAGGTCALSYPNYGGVINTPLGDYSGRIYIKFRVKGMPNADGTANSCILFTNLCIGGIYYPKEANDYCSVYENIKSDKGWTEIVYEMTNNNAISDSFVQFNCWTQTQGCLIDDVQIYRDLDYVYSPIGLKSSNFVEDGFWAEWSPVTTADSYLLSLVSEKTVGTENRTDMTDFNGVDTSKGYLTEDEIPDGWTLSIAGEDYLSSDKGYQDTPAIILTSGDMVELPMTGGVYTDLRFHLRKPASDIPESYMDIMVMDPSTGEWKRYAQMSYGNIYAEGTTVVIKEFEDAYPGAYDFANKYSGVRLMLTGEDAQVTIDNVGYTITPAKERKTVMEDIPAEDCAYTFTGLDPECEHYFTVKAVKGNQVTEATALTHAFGIATAVATEATDIDERGAFTANWNRVPRADRYQVEAYKVDIKDKDQKDYEILTETFGHTATGVTRPQDAVDLENYYDYTSLDKYTDNPGWRGRGNVAIDGHIGCTADENAMFEIFSPEFTASNAGGKYKVYVKAWAPEGAILIVQGTGNYGAIQFKSTGYYEDFIELENGQDHDRLMFYTYKGEGFLLDEVAVIQDLSAGDKLYSLLETVETTDTHYDFMVDPEACAHYAYQVTAFQTLFTKTVNSGASNTVFVDFEDTAVEGIEAAKGQAAVTGLKGAIAISTNRACPVAIWTLDGKQLAATTLQGARTFSVPAGIYLVRVADKSLKVIVK